MQKCKVVRLIWAILYFIRQGGATRHAFTFTVTIANDLSST